jgi:hypothetical protein
MTSFLGKLDETTRRRILDDLNYLNMSEIKRFCDKHSIPYRIWIQASDGALQRTPDQDRKGIILERIRHYLSTGSVPHATIFPMSVVNFDKPPLEIKPSDNLCYGQYDKNNRRMIDLLKRLTNGRFRNGAIARIIAREFWSKGKAPTYREFAVAWLEASDNHKRPNPEWAFLSDLAQKNNVSRWKQQRIEKAKDVLRILAQLDPKQ